MGMARKLTALVLTIALVLAWMQLPGSVPASYATSNDTRWVQDDSGWYRLENGSRVENSWRKDSHGWCYLGEDGYMLTNDWAKDSHGWCWLGGDGYMVAATKWLQYDGGWYHITNGYRDASKWMKDSKGWCHLGSDGRMVTNGWAKDSKGWCWLGANGYMLQKTQWVKYNNGWYHITSGYMDAGKWMKDSKGWCYLGSNGRMVTNGWAKDSKGWCWMGNDGYWVSKQWVQSGGEWYYIKDDHYMATGKITLANGTYVFDTSGKLRSVAGHTEHEYVTSTVAPTCTSDGYTVHSCSCGESYTDNYKSAYGHNWVAKTGTREVAYTAYREEPVYENRPVYETVNDYETISVCGKCHADITGNERAHCKECKSNWYSDRVVVGSHQEQVGTEKVQVGTQSVPYTDYRTETYTYYECSECGAPQ